MLNPTRIGQSGIGVNDRSLPTVGRTGPPAADPPPAETAGAKPHPVLLVIDTSPPVLGSKPQFRLLDPDRALIAGSAVDTALLDEMAVGLLESTGKPLDAIDMKVELPTKMSHNSFLISCEGGYARIYALGSQPIIVQPWGEPPRRQQLAGFPAGETLPQLTTLFLPESGLRGWRWRIGLVNPNAGFPAPARGPFGTDPEATIKPLEPSQLDALLVRFRDYFHFPARPKPEILRFKDCGDARKRVENRIVGIRDNVRAALENDNIGTGEELLAELIDRGTIRLCDVAEQADHLGVRLRGIEPLLELDDPRPGLVTRIHPQTRDLMEPDRPVED